MIFHDYTDKNTLIITFWLDWVRVASCFAANATGAFSPSIGFAVTTGGPRWTAFTFINTHQALKGESQIPSVRFAVIRKVFIWSRFKENHLCTDGA